MALRHLMIAGFFAALLAAPTAASAATGYTTGDVNLRTGPGTQYGRIAVIPGGVRIDVFGCSSWCSVNFQGYHGWISAKYVASNALRRPALLFRRPPPPRSGFYLRPWWDDQYNAWYDGRRWYRDGRWYSRPTFSLFFHFGG